MIGGARSDGNHFYDCGTGTGAADVCSTRASYVVVSYNWLEGGPDKDRGIDGVTLNAESHNWLIEYNLIEGHNDEVPGLPEQYKGTDHHGLEGPGEDGIDIKRQCHDIVIRGNVIRSHYYQTGFTLHGRGYNVFIYGNLFQRRGDRRRPATRTYVLPGRRVGFGRAVLRDRSEQQDRLEHQSSHRCLG